MSEKELTEVAVNMRADDGLTNGACNVVKSTQLNARSQPSGIIWVQFYQLDVGEKTRSGNKHLYVQAIDSA